MSFGLFVRHSLNVLNRDVNFNYHSACQIRVLRLLSMRIKCIMYNNEFTFRWNPVKINVWKILITYYRLYLCRVKLCGTSQWQIVLHLTVDIFQYLWTIITNYWNYIYTVFSKVKFSELMWRVVEYNLK